MEYSFKQEIFKLLGSRLTRNIGFWLFILYIKQGDFDQNLVYPESWYYGLMLFLLLFFISVAYINSFFLVPALLLKRKYFLYFPLVILFVFSMAFIYTFLLKCILLYLPGMDPFQVSIVSSPLSKNMAFPHIIKDMQINFWVMSIMVFIFTILWYSNENIRKMKQMQETINKHIETELTFLKSQINPHFLFNTLNNLYGLALQKSDIAPDAILKLSSILRYLLYESNVEQVSFEKEKEIMQAYIDLELLRMEEQHDFHFSIEADRDHSIAPLLWLPVLENVFKHGTRFINDSLFIDFKFLISNNKVCIYSKNKCKNEKDGKDNGIGGIGLDNLKKRLSLLYPARYNIQTKQENDFYITEIDIQL